VGLTGLRQSLFGLVAGCQTVRRVARTGIPVAFSAFRTRSRSLSPARRHFTASAIPALQTEVSRWYKQIILACEWGFPAERFTSQAFWDAFAPGRPKSRKVAERGIGGILLLDQFGEFFGGAEIGLMNDRWLAVDAGTFDQVVVEALAFFLF
jgi:hypothetical protein